jgi:Domain of unknown function (DUF1996)
MTAPPPNLRDALEVWVFEPESQGWDDVLRRAEAGGWSDVLRRARLRRPPTRLSRRTLIAAAALLGIAGPALGLVASTQTLGRTDTAPGPRLTALLRAPEGGSGTFTASLPGAAIAHRGGRGLFVPTRIARPGSDAHTPFSPLVWRLELRGVPEPVESVRLLERDGGVVATLCEPCLRSSGRTDIATRQAGPLFNGGADLEVRTGQRTLRGRVRFVPRLKVLRAQSLFAASAKASTSRPGLHGGAFFSNCRFSHTASDDPIALPRQPGRSHPHTFFGNTTTDAFSTLPSLRAGATTCRPTSDTAAYWVPTLLQGGREVRPAKAQIYYVLRGYRTMRPFPPGLRMIAGDANARRPQSTAVTSWSCGGHAARSRPSARVPAVCPRLRPHYPVVLPRRPLKTKLAPQQTFLQLQVNFPDCWDGKRLDSDDHKSHMAYSREFVCPRSHPVKVPLIRLMIRYPIVSGEGVELASGGQLSGHADFINAWDQRALSRLVADCFHDRPCNER